jgi:predicted ArsR family transcriptional regulator
VVGESGQEFEAQVEGVASLAEPIRRDLYRFVASQRAPVSRDEAASGVGVARHAAKFHLDKLVADGLLEADYSRPPGRGGPGAGRPTKRYQRADREFRVSVPERRYDLAGRLLARAVEDAAAGTPVTQALAEVASSEGESFGAKARQRAGRRPSRSSLTRVACELLAEQGFEPRPENGDLVLANCPFHALAEEHRQVVCGMNMSLLKGLVEGLGHPSMEAVFDPGPGHCCVRLRSA